MRTITIPWESWRAVIAVPREGAPCMLDHAARFERQLEQHPPGQAAVSLNFTDAMFLRSYNWARWQRGIPLPPE